MHQIRDLARFSSSHQKLQLAMHPPNALPKRRPRAKPPCANKGKGAKPPRTKNRELARFSPRHPQLQMATHPRNALSKSAMPIAGSGAAALCERLLL
jgi:hypothetical protein